MKGAGDEGDLIRLLREGLEDALVGNKNENEERREEGEICMGDGASVQQGKGLKSLTGWPWPWFAAEKADRKSMRGSPSGDQVITPLARDITKGRGEYVRAQNWSSRVIEREEEAEKEREREEAEKERKTRDGCILKAQGNF